MVINVTLSAPVLGEYNAVVVVAGRCISGSREALASYRVTGNGSQMGENAGYYIAEAIKTRQDIRDVKPNLTLTDS